MNTAGNQHAWPQPSPPPWPGSWPHPQLYSVIYTLLFFTLQQWVSCRSSVLPSRVAACENVPWAGVVMTTISHCFRLGRWGVKRSYEASLPLNAVRSGPSLYRILLICRRGQWCVVHSVQCASAVLSSKGAVAFGPVAAKEPYRWLCIRSHFGALLWMFEV